MRVLALQLKRIGDLVLTTPALYALKAAGAHVTLGVMDGGTAALLPLLAGDVDTALVYRSRAGNGALWKQLWRGKFDACVDFTGRDRSALMTLASRARTRIIARNALRKGRWRRLCYNAVAGRAGAWRATRSITTWIISRLWASRCRKDYPPTPSCGCRPRP